MQVDDSIINQVLLEVAMLLEKHKEELLEINSLEINNYKGKDTTIINRLKIDDKKLADMIASLETVAALPSPVNKVLYSYTNTEGLLIENRTAPFGTILIIYESRPDVTIEAAAIAFKSGNAIQLKGGKESHQSNQYLVSLWHKALEKFGLNKNLIQYLELDRVATQNYLQTQQHGIDLVIPRGGDSLIQFVKQYSTIPVIVSGRGNNFIYIDETANANIIIPIIINAKTSNISACNALDKLIIHTMWKELHPQLFQKLVDSLQLQGTAIVEYKKEMGDAILYEEFLSNKLLIIDVVNLQEAVHFINKYSGKHSASILSSNEAHINQFTQQVDCAAVYSNASTRFTDGGQFGLGAEMAISTDKLHHRGPLGLQHLVTNKWVVKGNGDIRN
jgi:glutamate-5-semialdehyde dehydrogenase